MAKQSKPVALIIGAGNFLGAAIAKRFAAEGFHIVATRRRGDLDELIQVIENNGGSATGVHSDARDEQAVTELIERTEADIGELNVSIFNVGGNVRFPITETTSRVYRKVWEMCALAGFLVGRESAKVMLTRRTGSIFFTGATASIRGASGYSAFSGGKHALRALAQSMARELGPEGIHIAHVIIDGPIDNDITREMFPDFFASRPTDGIMPPEALAEIYWQLHRQPRAAWTFEQDVRSYVEPW